MFAASLQLFNNGNLDLERRPEADLTLHIKCLSFEEKRTGVIVNPLSSKVHLSPATQQSNLVLPFRTESGHASQS